MIKNFIIVVLVAMAMAYGPSLSAREEEVVVGFIGASGCSGSAPGHPSLYGGKYLDLPTALVKISDYRILSAAQAGAWSLDRDTGQDGYWRQAVKLATMTTLDGVSTLDAVVIDIVSECNAGCDLQMIDEMIARERTVIDLVVSYGVPVIINGFPTTPIYDKVMVDRHYELLSGIVGTYYTSLYEGVPTSDGVHPSTEGMVIAAARLKTILDNQR